MLRLSGRKSVVESISWPSLDAPDQDECRVRRCQSSARHCIQSQPAVNDASLMHFVRSIIMELSVGIQSGASGSFLDTVDRLWPTPVRWDKARINSRRERSVLLTGKCFLKVSSTIIATLVAFERLLTCLVQVMTSCFTGWRESVVGPPGRGVRAMNRPRTREGRLGVCERVSHRAQSRVCRGVLFKGPPT